MNTFLMVILLFSSAHAQSFSKMMEEARRGPNAAMYEASDKARIAKEDELWRRHVLRNLGMPTSSEISFSGDFSNDWGTGSVFHVGGTWLCLYYHPAYRSKRISCESADGSSRSFSRNPKQPPESKRRFE